MILMIIMMIILRQLIRLTWGRGDQLDLAKASLVFVIGDFSDRHLQVTKLPLTIIILIIKRAFSPSSSVCLMLIIQIQEEINEEAKQFGDILQVEKFTESDISLKTPNKFWNMFQSIFLAIIF